MWTRFSFYLGLPLIFNNACVELNPSLEFTPPDTWKDFPINPLSKPGLLWVSEFSWRWNFKILNNKIQISKTKNSEKEQWRNLRCRNECLGWAGITSSWMAKTGRLPLKVKCAKSHSLKSVSSYWNYTGLTDWLGRHCGEWGCWKSRTKIISSYI